MVLLAYLIRTFYSGNFKNLLRSSFPLLMAALGADADHSSQEELTCPWEELWLLCNVVCVMSMNPDSAWGFVPALGQRLRWSLACRGL